MSTMHISTATTSYLRSIDRIATRTAAWGMAERLTEAAAGMRVALERLPDGSPHQLLELRGRAALMVTLAAEGTAEHAAISAAHTVFLERALAWADAHGLGTRPVPH